MVRKPQNATVHNKTKTSRAAADRAKLAASGQRLQVLNHIRKQGEIGATDKEIQTALDLSGDSQRPRRRELELAGQITESIHFRDGCKIWLYVEPIENTVTPNTKSRAVRPATLDSGQHRNQKQKSIDFDRNEDAKLESQYGPDLDGLSVVELGDLIVNSSGDKKSRTRLQQWTERHGRSSSFVRHQLLTALKQKSESECSG